MMKAYEAKAIADERMAKRLSELEDAIEAELGLIYEYIHGHITRLETPSYGFTYSTTINDKVLQASIIERLEADGYTVTNKYFRPFHISWKDATK